MGVSDWVYMTVSKQCGCVQSHVVPVVISRRLLPPARVERVGVVDAYTLDVERVQPDRAALGDGEAVVVIGLGAGANSAYA